MFLKNFAFLAVFFLIFVINASCGDIDNKTKGTVDSSIAVDAEINDELLSTPQKVMDLFLKANKTKDLRLLQAAFSKKIQNWSFEMDILKIVSFIKADNKSVVEKYGCNYGDYIYIVLQKPKGGFKVEFQYKLRKFGNTWKIIGYTFIPNENYPPLDPEDLD